MAFCDILKGKGGMTMDIRVLRYFLAVAREGNISGAAEALHMTQPPLSKIGRAHV